MREGSPPGPPGNPSSTTAAQDKSTPDKAERVKVRLEIIQLIFTLVAALVAGGSWLKSCQVEAVARAALASSLEVEYVEIDPRSFDLGVLTSNQVFGGKLVVPIEFDELRKPNIELSRPIFEATDEFLKQNEFARRYRDELIEQDASYTADSPPSLSSIAERMRLVFLRVANTGGAPARDVRLKVMSLKGSKGGVRLADALVAPRDNAEFAGKDYEIMLSDIAPKTAVLVPLCYLLQFMSDDDVDQDFAIGPFLSPKEVSHQVDNSRSSFPIRKKRNQPFLLEKGYELRG